MEDRRVLGYSLAKEITYEEMREIAGGGGQSSNRTYDSTQIYTHPIGTDMTLDSDLVLDM